MSSYSTSVSDASPFVSLGSPTLNDGDSISFTKFATQFTTAYDFAADFDAAAVTIGPEFEGSFDITKGGAPLKIKVDNTNAGNFYYKAKRSGRIDVRSTSNATEIYNSHLDGQAPIWYNDCKLPVLFANTGTVVIMDNVDLTTGHIQREARVLMQKTSGAFVPTTWNIWGELEAQSDFGTANVKAGGKLTLNESTITPVAINTEGEVKFISCGTIAALTCTGPYLLDFYNLQGDLTIGGTTSLGPGGKIILRRNGPTITWTTSNTSTAPKYEYRD
jgi:hypothetical protein